MTQFMFTPAVREQAKARIALAGPPGSGKTYTSLALATAMGNRVAVIDTEHGSASKYATGKDGSGFTFDSLALTRFEPRDLVGALAAASQAGYPVVVIDSLSHFWSGVGGMIEQADNAARRYNGNTFAGWKDARPMERELIEAMLAYPGHLIATMRSKTEYVIEENDRGRKTPRKVGTKLEQREGIEYEFDVVGDLDIENTLVVSKSRCPALSGAVVSRPGAEFAERVTEWLSSGAEVPESSSYIDQATSSELTYEQARELYLELESRRLLSIPMLDPESGDPVTIGPFLWKRGHHLKPVDHEAA